MLNLGFQTFLCENEEEARSLVESCISEKKWPCLFAKSDTTGEKDFEEFFIDGEVIDSNSYNSIGVVKSRLEFDANLLDLFTTEISGFKENLTWSRDEIVAIFHKLIPNFHHKETGKFLDNKM